ncbi:MAG: zinc-binding dehydrogenase, partial [Janthinobacterium lividum]
CERSRAIGVRASGGFGDLVTVPHARYLFDLGDLDPALAATYACSGLTVYSAVTKLLPCPPDEPVVLIGAGGLGLSGIAVLRALGHRNIVVTDIGPAKLGAALDAGASATVENSGDDVAARIMAAAGGPVRRVIDLVNNAATAPLALSLLARGGKVVQVGLFGGAMTLPLMTVPMRALMIQGSFVGSPAEMRALIALARSGALAPIPTTTMPKSSATAALTALRDGKVSGRIVLVA